MSWKGQLSKNLQELRHVELGNQKGLYRFCTACSRRTIPPCPAGSCSAKHQRLARVPGKDVGDSGDVRTLLQEPLCHPFHPPILQGLSREELQGPEERQPPVPHPGPGGFGHRGQAGGPIRCVLGRVVGDRYCFAVALRVGCVMFRKQSVNQSFLAMHRQGRGEVGQRGWPVCHRSGKEAAELGKASLNRLQGFLC